MKAKSSPNWPNTSPLTLPKPYFIQATYYLDYREKKELVGTFINIDLCKITEDFVFTHPYERNETNVYNPELNETDLNKFHQDCNLKIAVADMNRKFMTETQALIHGDLHTGSIMANEDETYMIDPEFAFFGPMGFDIGAILGNVLMSYFSHEYRQVLLGRKPYSYRKWLLDTVEGIWEGFEKKFDRLWKKHEASCHSQYWNYDSGKEHFNRQRKVYLHDLLQDSLGFAACKMMRRILGLAKVADIADIDDLKERAKIERMTLQMGKSWLRNVQAFTPSKKSLNWPKIFHH